MDKELEKKFRNLAYLIGLCTFIVFFGVPAMIFFVSGLAVLGYLWSNSLLIPQAIFGMSGWLMIIIFLVANRMLSKQQKEQDEAKK